MFMVYSGDDVMNKTDFAELKEKLTKLDDVVANEYLTRYMEGFYDEPTYKEYGEYVHTKSAAIISELIEIISYQESLIESNFKRSKETAIWIEKKQFENDEYDGEWYVKSTEPFNELEIIRENCKEALSETTTRLQKLRDGK